MTTWFRMYAEVVDDPKVQMLPPDLFKSWVNILCLACRNNGILPPVDQLAFSLRCDEAHALAVVERLTSAGLIDRLAGGSDGVRNAPHGWSKRQYKSDTSTERVKRFRAVARNAPETETETETDNNASSLRSEALPRAEIDETKAKARASPDRATRLPRDWTAPPAFVDFATGLGFSLDDIRSRIEPGFRDYWISAGGAQARKADWFATWRNWVRREQGTVSKPRGAQAGGSRGQAPSVLDAYRRAASRFQPQDDVSRGAADVFDPGGRVLDLPAGSG